jgi:hypothetical protein
VIKGGDLLCVASVRPLDLWLKRKKNINELLTRRRYTEERFAVHGSFTHLMTWGSRAGVPSLWLARTRYNKPLGFPRE